MADAMGAVGGFAQGFANVWQQKRQKDFLQAEQERKATSDMLQSIFNDVNRDPGVRQRAMEQYLSLQQLPPGKRPKVNLQDLVSPQAPPDAPQKAIASVATAATQAPTPQQKIQAQAQANLGVQAPPPPPDQMPGTVARPNQTGSLLGPVWSERLPGGAPNPTNTPMAAPGTVSAPPQATVAQAPSVTAGLGQGPAPTLAPPPAMPAQPTPQTPLMPPPPPDTTGGLFPSASAIAINQAQAQAAAANVEMLKQKEMVRSQLQQLPGYQQLSAADQEALAYDPEGKSVGLLPLLKMQIPGFSNLSEHDQQQIVQRKVGAGIPFSMLRPVAGKPAQDEQGNWYVPHLDPMSGNEVYRQSIPPPPGYLGTEHTSTNAAGDTTVSKTKKIIPGQNQLTAPPAPPSANGPARPQAAQQGGVKTAALDIKDQRDGVEAMARNAQDQGIKPPAAWQRRTQQYMDRHNMVPTWNVPASLREKAGQAIVARSSAIDIIDDLQKNSDVLNSAISSGKIKLATDPGTGALLVSRAANLSDQEAQVATDWQLLAEHINLLRGPMQAQGFRSKEAFDKLQSQRGQLMADPRITRGVLAQTRKVLAGLNTVDKMMLGQKASEGVGTPHIIEIKGQQYQYNGTGATDDLSNYTPVKK